MANTKLITIPHTGPIYPKSGIFGPIETPYVEDVSVIGTLLMKNYPVIEHKENGEQVELTLSNFDNGAIKVVEHTEVVDAPKAPVEEVEKEEAPAAPVEEEKEADVQIQSNQQKQNKKNKKNRAQADDLEAK